MVRVESHKNMNMHASVTAHVFMCMHVAHNTAYHAVAIRLTSSLSEMNVKHATKRLIQSIKT